MKTTERIIRDKHTRIPDKYKKIDTSQRECGKPCRRTQGSGEAIVSFTP